MTKFILGCDQDGLGRRDEPKQASSWDPVVTVPLFFFNYINLCMCVHMFDIAHIKKSEHSFWESFIPFYHVCPWFQRRSPGLAASTFSHSAV